MKTGNLVEVELVDFLWEETVGFEEGVLVYFVHKRHLNFVAAVCCIVGCVVGYKEDGTVNCAVGCTVDHAGGCVGCYVSVVLCYALPLLDLVTPVSLEFVAVAHYLLS